MIKTNLKIRIKPILEFQLLQMKINNELKGL